MASSTICCGSEPYDSGEFYNGKKFVLDAQEKMECLDVLHSSKTKPVDKKIFKTWTSHWVRSNKVSRAAYHLFKVKRWYLLDENHLFDPFKKCEVIHNLTPAKTLWRSFPENGKIVEGVSSVDSMLSIFLTPKQRDVIEKLDTAMEPLHEDVDVKSRGHIQILSRDMLENKVLLPDSAAVAYRDFVRCITRSMHLHASGIKLPEIFFEEAFMKLVECMAACIDGSERDIRCARNVHGSILDKVVVPVKSGEQDVKLEVSSRPDLFVYQAADTEVPMLVLGVVEVKGLLNNDEYVQSDDEGDEDGNFRDVTQCSQYPSKDDDKNDDEDDDDDDDESDNEEQLEKLGKLLRHTPTWLDKITNLPQRAQKAVKAFLPQLIGEMMCCARSKGFRPIKNDDGLLFGIGVTGFDVYFVSMIDSCRGTSKSVVNSDSACTHVFVTRPFNIRNRLDRQVILKVMAASFILRNETAFF